MVDHTTESSGGCSNSKGVHYPARLLAKNTIYNLMGRILPMAVALAAIPYIIEGLGVERFGVLTLAWMVVGYFGIFDMGIGRATTKFVAQAMSRREQEQLPSLVWTSLLLLVAFGIVGGVLAALLTPWLVSDVLNIPEALKGESRMAFLLLAASMPFVLGTSGARGVLEGQQRFRLVNAIKIPASAATFLMPLAVLFFSNNLFHIVAVLVGARCIVFFIHAYVCIASLPGRRAPRFPQHATAKRLLSFGGWLTATNVFGSLMALGYVDRFMISTILNMSALTYYSTPFEMISKLLFLAAGLVGVLFPVFCAHSKDQLDYLYALHLRAIKGVLVCLSPLIVVMIAFAKPILTVWLDIRFAQESALIMQVISAGVLVQSLAAISASVVQALGRPDLTAKRHMIQLPIYLAAAWFCIKTWGIVGLALVWACWVFIDAIILFGFIQKLLPRQSALSHLGWGRLAGGIVVVLMAAFFLGTIPSVTLRGLLTIIVIAGFVAGCWKYVLDTSDRNSFVRLYESYSQ